MTAPLRWPPAAKKVVDVESEEVEEEEGPEWDF